MRLAHLFALPGGFEGRALMAQPLPRSESVESRLRGNAMGSRNMRPMNRLLGPATLGATASSWTRRRRTSEV